MKTIKVNNVSYQKTAAFGNRSQKNVFRNRRSYDRKDKSWKKD